MTKPSVFYIIDDDRDDQNYLITALKEIDSTSECFKRAGRPQKFRDKSCSYPLYYFPGHEYAEG
jgi:hypothetical protein